jgi:transcriptional regulator with XRE-family HTH domain
LKELAQALGRDESTVSRIERAERGISVPLLYRVAQILELRDLERLLRPWAEPLLARDTREVGHS